MDVPLILKRIEQMLQDVSPEGSTALGEVRRNTASDPFVVLISTILSHRTKDQNTLKACNQLFSIYRTPKEIADADVERIQELIRPAGFYRVKAQRIKEVSHIIADKFEGKVPKSIDQLLTLPSVGRKTANCVLVYGFNEPAIPVDTHVHRIANRLGLVKTKTPEQTELRLTETVEKRYWLAINELFVRFGQKICRPVRPRCEICYLKDICAYYRSLRRQPSLGS